MININRIIVGTRSEGPGVRLCIWFQGCSHHCEACYAEDTWSFSENRLFSVNEIFDMIDQSELTIEGITVLGGEPFDQNRELFLLLQEARRRNLSCVVFTGYTIDELKRKDEINNAILELVDVLIDGPYIKELRSFDVPLVGSSNQKIHFLTNRYSRTDFLRNKIEIRISKKGIISINGMGDFPKIKDIYERNL